MGIWVGWVGTLWWVEGAEPTAEARRGDIEGRIVDLATRSPVAKARVEILHTPLQVRSDPSGLFRFSGVKAGSYVLACSANGYEMTVKTDIIVSPRRLTRLEVELSAVTPRLEEKVTVVGQFFSRSEKAPASVFNFSAEEIRRAPGSYGDINRMMKILPGTVNADDSRNDLIVRGGNPSETGFVIENLEVPNLSHFPSMRSSGGRFSALNPDLIQEVDFYTGNYPVEYGDRLSSVLNIRMREGNPREFNGQIDFNLGLAGAVVEGPLPGGKGSWVFSYRNSYLALVEKLGVVDFQDYIPRMSDAQGKAVINLGPKNRLTILDFYGGSGYRMEKNDELDELDALQNTIGVNWQFLWSEKGYSETSLGFSFARNRTRFARPGNEEQASLEETVVGLRHQSFWKVSDLLDLHIGFQAKRERLATDYRQNRDGVLSPSVVEQSHRATRSALFATAVWKPRPPLSVSLGIRADFSTWNRSWHASPRLTTNLQLSRRWSLHAGFGFFSQSLSLLMPLIRWNWDSYDYPDPQSEHWTIGAQFLPNPGAKLSLELYDKAYRFLPVSPEYPDILPMDRRPYESSVLPKRLFFTGRARGRGIEFFWQKKMTERFYGLGSLSIARSRYCPYSEKWYDRNYDVSLVANLAVGYRFGATWEVGTRWTFATGMPYTPFDLKKSQALNRGVLDTSRTNGERLPEYSSVNLRGDKRFLFRSSNLIVYIEIWNLLNRGNVYRYIWDRALRGVAAEKELPLIPLLGLEFEF